MPTYKQLSKEEREDLRQRALAGPILVGSAEVLALMAENDRLRSSLARGWSAYLETLLDARFEDGTSVLEVVFAFNPGLHKRLYDAVFPPVGDEP